MNKAKLLVATLAIATTLISSNVTTSSKNNIVVLDDKITSVQPMGNTDPGGSSG